MKNIKIVVLIASFVFLVVGCSQKSIPKKDLNPSTEKKTETAAVVTPEQKPDKTNEPTTEDIDKKHHLMSRYITLGAQASK